MRRVQQRETRREMRMIVAVILAVLAISGAIIYLALRRSIHNETTSAPAVTQTEAVCAVPDTGSYTGKENGDVRI